MRNPIKELGLASVSGNVTSVKTFRLKKSDISAKDLQCVKERGIATNYTNSSMTELSKLEIW